MGPFSMVELVRFRNEWIGICGDLVLVVNDRGARMHIATHNGIYELPSQRITIGSTVFDPSTWFEPGPLANFSIYSDVDDAAKYVTRVLGDRLRGKRIGISFSGGKDSVTLAAVLKKVCEHVGCELYAIYIHMPFIEPVRYVKEVERIAKAVGVELTYGEPPRKIVAKYLIREGLPYRRARWCTYLKTRRLRQVAFNELKCNYVAIGDRIWENLKRFSRLSRLVLQEKLSSKKAIYPIAPATLCDTIGIARSLNALHVAYVEGCLRVSCLMCPYKSVIELSRYSIDNELEDPGFIHWILKREWRKWYADKGIAYEDFVGEALWRFVPKVAKMFLEVKKVSSNESETKYTHDEVRDGIAKFMINPGCCQRLGLEAVETVARVLSEGARPLYINVLELVKSVSRFSPRGC